MSYSVQFAARSKDAAKAHLASLPYVPPPVVEHLTAQIDQLAAPTWFKNPAIYVTANGHSDSSNAYGDMRVTQVELAEDPAPTPQLELAAPAPEAPAAAETAPQPEAVQAAA